MNLRDIEVTYTDGTVKNFTAHSCSLDASGQYFAMIVDNIPMVWLTSVDVVKVITSEVEIMPEGE